MKEEKEEDTEEDGKERGEPLPKKEGRIRRGKMKSKMKTEKERRKCIQDGKYI